MELLSNSTPSSRRRNKRSPLGPGAMGNINDAKVNKAINTQRNKLLQKALRFGFIRGLPVGEQKDRL